MMPKKKAHWLFFGEKYQDKVRVITVGDFSKELCGGSHVDNTSEISFLKLLEKVPSRQE